MCEARLEPLQPGKLHSALAEIMGAVIVPVIIVAVNYGHSQAPFLLRLEIRRYLEMTIKLYAPVDFLVHPVVPAAFYPVNGCSPKVK